MALPNGSSSVRVGTVLDSLGFGWARHDSTVLASKREPQPSRKLVFSTLQVEFTFGPDGLLKHQESKELLTGP